MSVRGKPSPVSVLRAQTRGDGLVLGFGVDGARAVAVGGQGRDLFLWSDDGETFSAKKSPGPGLRSAFLQGDELWVVGEYGYVAFSSDRGETWARRESGTRGCLFGIAPDSSGNWWLGGDGGFLAVSTDGVSLTKLSGIRE